MDTLPGDVLQLIARMVGSVHVKRNGSTVDMASMVLLHGSYVPILVPYDLYLLSDWHTEIYIGGALVQQKRDVIPVARADRSESYQLVQVHMDRPQSHWKDCHCVTNLLPVNTDNSVPWNRTQVVGVRRGMPPPDAYVQH